MFTPQYAISPKLLENIKRISTISYELNHKQFPKIVLMALLKQAHEISAHASTSIEGNPLPLTEVKRIIKSRPAHIRNSEQEVLNYNNALVWLDDIKKKEHPSFNRPFLLQIHKIVTHKLLSPGRSGKIRQEPVFVNDPQIGKTVYWPPDHQDVITLLNDLLAFVAHNKKILDPLLIAGIFHKQFVIIHPFMDGNGRTVRLATKVLLSAMGLNTFNLFSFENYYNQKISQYFKYVGVKGNYYDLKDRIDFTPWLEYFTDGIIDELLRVSQILEQKKITPETVLLSQHHIILDYIKKHGYITDKIYSTLTPRAKPTRNQDFAKLIRLQLVERVGKGKSTLYRIK